MLERLEEYLKEQVKEYDRRMIAAKADVLVYEKLRDERQEELNSIQRVRAAEDRLSNQKSVEEVCP